MRKSLALIALLSMFLIGLTISKKPSNLHHQIKTEDITSVTLWGINGHSEATQEEVYNIISWFNSASDIRENKDFAGVTPDSGIIINDRNGKELSIIRSGRDFEVQRNDSGRAALDQRNM